MKKTVFISSTYEDLQEERRLVWDLLEKFEVTVRGMEQFGARPESPIETCLAEIETSDIYIGIIAYRLGSIENNSGKSFTQLEYERAYEHKDVLIYMIDDEKAKVLAKYIDKDERRETLEAFKRILKERHTVATYYSPEDLVKQLGRDFRRLLQSKNPENQTDLDEYHQSADLIKNFLLVPKEISGSEVRLQIRMKGNPFPASKEVCDSLNLDFGATIGVRIQIINPDNLGETGIDTLYLNAKQMDDFGLLNNGEEREIYAKLQFRPIRIDRLRARLSREVEYDSPLFANLNIDIVQAIQGKRTILEAVATIALLLTRNIIV
jgi:hypothetical protein